MDENGKKQKKNTNSEESKLIKKFLNDKSNVSAKDAMDVFDAWMTKSKSVSEDEENTTASQDTFAAFTEEDEDSMLCTDRYFFICSSFFTPSLTLFRSGCSG